MVCCRAECQAEGARPAGDSDRCEACPGCGNDRSRQEGDVGRFHWVREDTDKRIIVNRKEIGADVGVCYAVGHQRAWLTMQKERKERERTGR